MKRFELRLFGVFRLATPDGRDIPVSSQKSRALLALLATSRNGERDRKRLRELLWERSAPAQQRSSLSQELTGLRRILAGAGAGNLLSANHRTIRLDLARITLDIPGPDAGDPESLRSADAEFLEGIEIPGCHMFGQWLDARRSEFRQLRRQTDGNRGTLEAADWTRMPTARETLASLRPSRPPKPSVAILPFATSPGMDEALGLALADGLTIRLTRFPQIFVAGSASATAMARMGLLREEVAARLGVRYTIDGLILQAGDLVRISVALVDSDTGEQVWGETFRERVDGTGSLEDAMVDRIAPQLWSKIDTSERRSSLRQMGIGSDRYERWWRANALYRSFSRAHVLEALAIAEGLAEEDPACPFGTSLAAFLTGLGDLLGHLPEGKDPLAYVNQCSTAAIRADPDNPEILGYCAGASLLSGGDLGLADAWIERALQLLPGYQPTLFWGGCIDIACGRPTRARERFEMALRINPATGVRGPTLCGLGLAALLEGDAPEALMLLRDARSSDPGFPLTHLAIMLTATLVGDEKEAEEARACVAGADPMRLLRRLRGFEIGSRLESLIGATGEVD